MRVLCVVYTCHMWFMHVRYVCVVCVFVCVVCASRVCCMCVSYVLYARVVCVVCTCSHVLNPRAVRVVCARRTRCTVPCAHGNGDGGRLDLRVCFMCCMRLSEALATIYRIGLCVSQYNTPLERLSKLDCSTTKRVPIVPIPNHTSLESSQRHVSNADLLGTYTIPITTPNVGR